MNWIIEQKQRKEEERHKQD